MTRDGLKILLKEVSSVRDFVPLALVSLCSVEEPFGLDVKPHPMFRANKSVTKCLRSEDYNERTFAISVQTHADIHTSLNTLRSHFTEYS